MTPPSLKGGAPHEVDPGLLQGPRRSLADSPTTAPEAPCPSSSPSLAGSGSTIVVVNNENEFLQALAAPGVRYIEVRQHLDLTNVETAAKSSSAVQEDLKGIRVRLLLH